MPGEGVTEQETWVVGIEEERGGTGVVFFFLLVNIQISGIILLKKIILDMVLI